MTAWQELLTKSTAVVGSIAWEHLISPAPGGPPGGSTDPVVLCDSGLIALDPVQGVALSVSGPRSFRVINTGGYLATPGPVGFKTIT